MRILHLDSGRDMRGGQWQSLRLHQGLLARGHESILLTRGEMNPWEISRKYDVVHAHDARSHTLAALFARSPLVVSRRVAFPIRSRWKYGRAALFIAVSNHVAGILREHGIGENRVVTVYDGVPLPDHVSPGGDLIIGLAHKGAARAGVKVSQNLEADLPTAKALVYLSDCEGLGSGILLAMAHGVPVIASNVGGISEVVRNGVNGVLVNDDSEIPAAISRLTPEMRQAARKTIETRFTVDQMVDGTIAAYKRCGAGLSACPQSP